MDNSKSYCPHYLENAKDLVGTERLPTKIYGGLIWSGLYEEKRKIIFYLNHDQFGKICMSLVDGFYLNFVENGSDMVVTIVYHLLREFMQDHGGNLPKKLHLNLGMYLEYCQNPTPINLTKLRLRLDTIINPNPPHASPNNPS